MLLVGCPVFKRAWSLQAWFSHVEASCVEARLNPHYIFAGDPERDAETFGVIEDFAAGRHSVVYQPEPTRQADVRDWYQGGPQRFERMVELRNALLAEVRRLDPTWFLSLDSDVLVHPRLVANLVDTSARYAAVGGRLYMTAQGRDCPSFAFMGRDNRLHREDTSGVHPIDVVMACVLMNRGAYAIDYEFHHLGEDIGHALAMRRAGLKVAADGRVVNRHVMSPAALDEPDLRCDAEMCP